MSEHYSQNNEQEILLAALPATGRFLDVGAFHPKALSNTRALYERGWSGVMVEPSPGPMLELLKEYGYDERITLIQALVGWHVGIVSMEITNDAVSTTDKDVRRTWSEVGGYFGRCFVPQIETADLITRFGPFDLIDIDAEGQSFGIFADLLNHRQKPRCICVEHDGTEEAMTNLAASYGYELIHANGENLIFLR